MASDVTQCTHGTIHGSVSLEKGAEYSGIDEKRLRGLLYRNSVHFNDPVGCAVCGRVMLWSLPQKAEDGSTINRPDGTAVTTGKSNEARSE